MILNIETKNPQSVLKDLTEVFSNSEISIVNQWETVSEFELKSKDGKECVYPIEGLIELYQYYGLKIRIR